MTTETLHEPPLPELPPEIAEAVARTVTYANDDESITVVVGPDMRLASITVEHLEDPTAIGPATVRAVNRALLLARGGVEDDLDAQAEQRIAELDAELDKIHSTLDGIDRQLDDIDRSL